MESNLIIHAASLSDADMLDPEMDMELINDLETQTMTESGTVELVDDTSPYPISYGFQVSILLGLGIIAGIMFVGSRK